jgi:hypothetical protein
LLDHLGRLQSRLTIPTTRAGYQQLVAWAGRHGQLTQAGVEGTGTYGAGLTRFLTQAGVTVVEVDRPTGWWKVQSKPEQASGEDRLLAFEHLVAAAALVIIAFFKAWQNPQGSKNEMGWLFALFVVLVFVLLGFANSVKNRVFAKSEAYYLAVYANPRVEVPVYRIDPTVAVRLSVGAAVVLLAIFLVVQFIVTLA